MIRALEWDSEFFGFPIGDLLPGTPIDVEQIEAFLAAAVPSLIQSRVSIADADRIGRLQEAGFRLVDVRASFRFGVVGPAATPASIRRATRDDIPELIDLARDLFQDSRYFCAPFPRERSRALFATWAEKAVLGTFDDACLIARHEDGVAGFVTLRAGGGARIGLLGVAPEAQGRRIGSSLVDAALAWAARDGAEVLDVSTQGRNLRAQNLYIAKGARLTDIELWFYRTSSGRPC